MAAGGIVGVILAGMLVIACSWAVSWIFALVGVLARTAATVQGASFLVLFPLAFLSTRSSPHGRCPAGFRASSP